MVRPETYDSSKRRRQPTRPDRTRQLQDEATRAWNFFTALYYKAGGLPWRLVRVPGAYAACYVGVSFYRTPTRDRLLTGMAQVFNERGDGMVVKGGPARYEKADRQVHLDRDGARSLLSHALQSYRREHHQMPARVEVHKTSRYDGPELEGFREAADAERVEELELLTT